MRSLLSGNDFCGSMEAMGCHAHRDVWLILSTHTIACATRLFVHLILDSSSSPLLSPLFFLFFYFLVSSLSNHLTSNTSCLFPLITSFHVHSLVTLLNTADAMDESLAAEIPVKIERNMSEVLCR